MMKYLTIIIVLFLIGCGERGAPDAKCVNGVLYYRESDNVYVESTNKLYCIEANQGD